MGKNRCGQGCVKLDANPETSGRFHSSWLSMIASRLLVARQLLRKDGIIFISIDENEEHHLRSLCDEIFGANNFIEKIVWNKRIPKNDKGIGNIHEYILLYKKDSSVKHFFKMPKDGLDEVYEFVEKLKRKKVPIATAETELKKFYNKKGYDRGITLYCNLTDEYRIWGKINVSFPNSKDGPRYDVMHPTTGKPTSVPDNGWRHTQTTFEEYLDYENIIERHDGTFVVGKVWFDKTEKTQPSTIQFLDDVNDFLLRSVISLKSSGGKEFEDLMGFGFDHPKTYRLIKNLVSTVDGKDFIVLDFFAGSGTTGQAIVELNKEDGGNRKFILVQIPEFTDEKTEAFKAGYKTISSITIERSKRVVEKRAVEVRAANSELFDDKGEAKIQNQIVEDLGFKVFVLDKSYFPRTEWTPAPEMTEEEKIASLQAYIAEKEQQMRIDFDRDKLLTEVLIKEGFKLTYKAEQITDFPENVVLMVTDGEKEAIVCLDDSLADSTVNQLREMIDDKVVVIERALDTTKKWNLHNSLGEKFKAF